jgi:WD40 repeat protein
MKLYIVIFLLIFGFLRANSQSLSIFDVDTTNFPIMKAKFFAFDKDGKQIRPNAGDFSITENGQPRTVLNLTCPDPKPQTPLSSVLVFDLSESMSGIWLDIQKAAAYQWIDILQLGLNDCAITSFSNYNYINQDFTTNISKLKTAIDNLTKLGGTDYNAAMIDSAAGAILIAKTGKHKKVIIFFTDGQPNIAPRTQDIIDEANKNNIMICCLSFNNPVHNSMREFSAKTNGLYFEYIRNMAEVETALKMIFVQAQNEEFCETSWLSSPICNNLVYNTVFNISQNSLKDSITYFLPEKAKAKLEFSPSSIMFGHVNPGKKKDTIITLTAFNSDFDLIIKNSNPAFIISPSNFTIKAGQSKNIVVSFVPTDSIYTFSKFSIDNNNCTNSFYASGGFYGKIPKENTLKLTKPNGGEEFVIGSDSLITWDGIPESDNVQLEYSLDNDSTWIPIANNVSGLNYLWKNIPKPESNQCKLRVKQGNRGSSGEPGTLQFTLEGSKDFYRIQSICWSPDGRFVAGCTSYEYGFIWDASNGNILHILDGGLNQLNVIKMSPDGSRVAITYNSKVMIWDVGTGANLFTLKHPSGLTPINLNWSPDGNRIATAGLDAVAIIWNTNTGGILKTLSGHKNQLCDVVWSPDGNRIATASIDSTTIIWDASSGNKIFTLKGHTNQVIDVFWSPDGKYVATISKDSTAIIWNSETGKIFQKLTGHTNFIYSLDWSPDGSKIVTGSWDATSIIWDALKGTKLHILNGSTNRVTKVKWNPNGTLLATSSSHGIGFIWDPVSGNNLYKLIGHSWDIWDLAWSPDGSRIATGAEDFGKIWFIDDLSFKQQQDESDNVFSIVQPHASAKYIDMKECLVGRIKDSVITDFIVNTGLYPVRIDSLYFTGTDSSYFRLLSHILPMTIKPNDKITLEFGFAPYKNGLHSADIVILTQSDTILQKIVGTGYQPQLSVKAKIIDFGQIEIGNERTFNDTALVKNISGLPITINKVIQMGPDKTQFEILSDIGSFTLQPNEERKLSIKFKTIFVGRTSGQIGLEYNGVGSPAIVGLFGTGIGCNLRIANDSAYAGESRNLKLIMEKVKSEGMATIAPNFEITLRFQNTLIAPINNPNWSILNDSTYLTISGKFGTSNEIAQIPVITGLGSVEETSVDIVDFILKDDAGNKVDYDYESESGTFKLLGICPEGGNRLMNPNGKIAISSVKPNPAEDNIEVELELVEKTGYTISIVNCNGQIVRNIIRTNTIRGLAIENIEISDLSSGVYNLILQTESERLYKLFLILK